MQPCPRADCSLCLQWRQWTKSTLVQVVPAPLDCPTLPTPRFFFSPFSPPPRASLNLIMLSSECLAPYRVRLPLMLLHRCLEDGEVAGVQRESREGCWASAQGSRAV